MKQIRSASTHIVNGLGLFVSISPIIYSTFIFFFSIHFFISSFSNAYDPARGLDFVISDPPAVYAADLRARLFCRKACTLMRRLSSHCCVIFHYLAQFGALSIRISGATCACYIHHVFIQSRRLAIQFSTCVGCVF